MRLVDRARTWVRHPRFLAVAPIAIGVAWLAWKTLRAIVDAAGHPAAALDDAYIHFQYARAIAEGHPLRFQAGEPISTGATSFLWPLLLAPFWAVGFRDAALLWPTWALSFVALGLLAHEAQEITRPLAGRAAAAGAAGMVLAFGGHLWCAASGMEVVPFAWLLARSVRRAAEWAEGARSAKRRRELLVLAAATPLMRPEGALFSLAIAAVLVAWPLVTTKEESEREATTAKGSETRRATELAARAWGLVALAVPVLQPLFLRVVTGATTTSTAQVKLLAGNPYYAGPAFDAAVLANLKIFFGKLLQGEVWSAEFLPQGGAYVAMLGLVALVLRAGQRELRVRAALCLVLALAMLVPCTYVTFLWNRLRYLWPFATGWLIGLACLARWIGDALGALSSRLRIATPLVAGAFVGLLATHLPGVIDDLADSAHGIDQQQATLGRWAKRHLPEDARIGVNDTGAIAYFSDRRTFDVVGLTTASEGRYWVAGAASRVEHYERLAREAPARLPGFFIVYPEWFGCEALLGEKLTEAVVHATILGGTTMEAHVADYHLLGSGEAPWSEAGAEVDAVDVADLESEAAHHYELLGAHEGEQLVRAEPPPEGTSHPETTVLDGGRTNRVRERFVIDTTNATHLVARVEAAVDAKVTVHFDGDGGASLPLTGGDWQELVFDVPAEQRKSGVRVTVEASVPIATYHYWTTRDARDHAER